MRAPEDQFAGPPNFILDVFDADERDEYERRRACFERSGVIKSMSLPGLWFSTHNIRDRDWWSLLCSVGCGVSRIGHHESMETIWHTGGHEKDWGDWLPSEAG